MKVCESALEKGVFAQAIRPPTVPEGTSRLRLTVMATHTEEDLRSAAGVLAEAGQTRSGVDLLAGVFDDSDRGRRTRLGGVEQ